MEVPIRLMHELIEELEALQKDIEQAMAKRSSWAQNPAEQEKALQPRQGEAPSNQVSQTTLERTHKDKQSQEPADQFQIMDFISDADEPLEWEDDEGASGLTNADMYSKRPGEEMEPGRRTPSKRVAFDPSTLGATNVGAGPSRLRPAETARQTSSGQRVPFPVNRTYGQGARGGSGEPYSSAQGNRTP
jgi:hypothetical protein